MPRQFQGRFNPDFRLQMPFIFVFFYVLLLLRYLNAQLKLTLTHHGHCLQMRKSDQDCSFGIVLSMLCMHALNSIITSSNFPYPLHLFGYQKKNVSPLPPPLHYISVNNHESNVDFFLISVQSIKVGWKTGQWDQSRYK